MFSSSITENLRSKRSFSEISPLSGLSEEISKRISSVIVLHGERTLFHLFETQSQDTILETTLDELNTHVDGS